MGSTWTVQAWEATTSGGYEWVPVVETESVWRALRAAVSAKRAGSGCVKIEWRG